MGSIVNIYSGPPGARILEGKAELIEVKYKGNGLYLTKCVFVNDPRKRVHVREYNIVEQMQLGERRATRE